MTGRRDQWQQALADVRVGDLLFQNNRRWVEMNRTYIFESFNSLGPEQQQRFFEHMTSWLIQAPYTQKLPNYYLRTLEDLRALNQNSSWDHPPDFYYEGLKKILDSGRWNDQKISDYGSECPARHRSKTYGDLLRCILDDREYDIQNKRLVAYLRPQLTRQHGLQTAFFLMSKKYRAGVLRQFCSSDLYAKWRGPFMIRARKELIKWSAQTLGIPTDYYGGMRGMMGPGMGMGMMRPGKATAAGQKK